MVRFCLHCNTHHQGRCPNANRRRGSSTARGYDSRWAKRSANLIARSPHCAHCGSTNDLTLDHIIPLNKGGTNATHNLQVLCRSCNSSKRDKTHHRGWDRREGGLSKDPSPAIREKHHDREVWVG